MQNFKIPFSNAVKNFKIPEFSDSNPLVENIPHPIFKAILQFKNHSSIIVIKTQEMDFALWSKRQ